MKKTILIIICFLLVAEFALRIRENIKPKEAVLYGQASYFLPHHFLNYRLKPNARDHNSLGFRGKELSRQKAEGSYRILCLGGSSVYGSRVSAGQAFPAALNDLMIKEIKNETCEVINAGVPGYTSANLLVLFEFKLLELSADMIIVYCGFNDIFARLMGVKNFDYSGFNVSWREPSWFRRMLFSSILAQKTIGRLGEKLSIRALSWPPHIHELIQGKPYQYYKADYQRNLTATSTAVFKRNILSLIQLAQANGVAVVLMPEVVNPDWKTDCLHQALLKGGQENTQALSGLAQERGVYFIDLSREFSGKKDLFADEVHLNPAGNRLLAELIAKNIKEIIDKH